MSNMGMGRLLFTEAGFPGGREKCMARAVVTDEKGNLVGYKRGNAEAVDSPWKRAISNQPGPEGH